MASRGQSRSLCSYNCSTLSFPKVSHSSFIRVIQSVKHKSFFRYYYPHSPPPQWLLPCPFLISLVLPRVHCKATSLFKFQIKWKSESLLGLAWTQPPELVVIALPFALWDRSGGFIGSTGPVVDSIGSGDFVDLNVQPASGTDDRATEYMAVAAVGSDDICIASIALTMPSGDNLVMYGDVPSQCGAPWYHSSEIPRQPWLQAEVRLDHQ